MPAGPEALPHQARAALGEYLTALDALGTLHAGLPSYWRP